MLWVIQESEMGNAAVAMKSMVGVANGKIQQRQQKKAYVIGGHSSDRGGKKREEPYEEFRMQLVYIPSIKRDKNISKSRSRLVNGMSPMAVGRQFLHPKMDTQVNYFRDSIFLFWPPRLRDTRFAYETNFSLVTVALGTD
jgi:hypothetical protein